MTRYSIEENAKLFEALRQNNDRIIKKYYIGLKSEFLKNISSRFSCLPKEMLDDIYQDSFIELGEKIISGSLKEEAIKVPIGAYLYGIGKNVAHKYIEMYGYMNLDQEVSTEIEEFPTLSENNSTLTEEDCELIREYVDKLAKPCSSILQKFYFEEYTMFGIARLNGYKSEDVAKTRKNKCMTKLKELIKKGLYGKFDIN